MLTNIMGRPAKIIYALLALAAIVAITQAKGEWPGVPKAQSSAAYGAGPQPLAPAGAIPVKTSSGIPSTSAPIGTSHHPLLGREIKHDLSRPLRDIRPLPPPKGKQEAPENPPAGNHIKGFAGIDPVMQNWFGPLVMPTPVLNFNGMGNLCGGCLPPDTNGALGPNNYVQIVNLTLQMFNKSGTSVYGPVAINTLWSGFGGLCETSNYGDPIAMYDPMANRWLISQFTAASPYGECIAISQTSNPTGAYYRYFFNLGNYSNGVLYDYPKFGVWPNGYYMSANRFDGGFTFTSAPALVFDRARMLQGLSATYQEFDPNLYSLMPSDMDGLTKPPVGSPEYFATIGACYCISLYKFHVDWTTPANSTFTGSDIPVAPFVEYYGSTYRSRAQACSWTRYPTA